MREHFKHAFEITNNNLFLTVPLVMFMLLLSVYVGLVVWSPGTSDAKWILAIITSFFMITAFIAGWLNMIKETIKPSSPALSPLQQISVGIGAYFLPLAGAFIIASVLMGAVTLLVYKLGLLMFGPLSFDHASLLRAVSSTQEMKVFVESLSMEQLMELFNWNMLFVITSTVFSFLFLLWVPEIMFCTKNPVVALWCSQKKLFGKFKNSLKLFFYLVLINFVISFLSNIAAFSPILYLLVLMLYFYFLVYVVVLVFLYSDREFCNKTENNCDCGADS